MTKHTRLSQRVSLPQAIFAVVLVGLFGFVYFNMKDLIFGAPLVIKTAQDGATLSEGLLPIHGTARHARTVLINGRSIFTDREGNFADGVVLSPGYNVVEVTLRDQFGKEKVKTYHLVYETSETVAQSNEGTVHYQQ